MELNTVEKPNASLPKGVAIIGNSVAAIQTALTLAQLGVEVKIITNSAALGWDCAVNEVSGGSSLDQRYLWPLLLRTVSHPLITLYSNTEVEHIEGKKDEFKVQVVQHPRYIREDLCTSCGCCQAECSVKLTSLLGEQRVTYSAIHTPILETRSVPSAYVIDKNGVAPCHAACPLGINVQGFVSLLANGKTDKALALINDAAPLSGILGRVCQHPCEEECNRAKVDSPVFIRALHRYAADNAPSGITYSRKSPAGSQQGRIAIVGSGPAGLTAAWELTRRGYSPTVFESHGVIGGMVATGIPRFRLPKEVRERDIEAIKSLGVDIRTGITVGRDVTFSYLRERGYRVFFLGIGCQQNNTLNIPGEELEGVVDCMSLLLALNLKVDIFAGLNVVVIGGGNAAIDAARSALRSGANKVTIFYRRTKAEMPANAEEVEEAIKEGVNIEYCTIPLEILGEGGKVTGIRCQQTKLTEEIMSDGRHWLEPIPGSEFVIEADHVVVAIGQSPDTPQLHMEGLETDSTTGAIKVNPLTLETSVPGVFAGGDCITGPNNVVEAMAAGLRAAESIDRYLQGRNLEVGRSLETPPLAEIDVETIEVAPYPRASMPAIGTRMRKSSFEETTTGLSTEVAHIEAQRCLNCSLCSQCLECVRTCELEAVFHDDSIRHFEVGAEVILRFPTDGDDHATDIDGLHDISPGNNGGLADQITRAMAVALETSIEIEPSSAQKEQGADSADTDAVLESPPRAPEKATGSQRIGVFLCRCGGSINSIIDFRTVARRLLDSRRVTRTQEIAQACTEAGARQIADDVAEWELDGVVLAACRCCNSEQICYSCTDRRQLCQQYLEKHLILPRNTTVEFVNIREQCAWVHKDAPRDATRKAVQIISSGVNRARLTPPVSPTKRPVLPGALIIGGGLVSITTARALASRGYEVELVTREQNRPEEIGSPLPKQLREADFTSRPWPNTLRLHGSPGNYEVVLEYGSQVDCVKTGAVLVDMKELNSGKTPLLNATASGSLLDRIISRRNNADFPFSVGDDLRREVTITETAGLFLLPPDGAESPDEEILRGLATAARVSAFLEQASITPRAMAVSIDRKLCRGCGNCSDICPYIEMIENGDGTKYACIDNTLCLGCGACLTTCPTGAITQAKQSDRQMLSTLRSLLRPSQILSEV